ncbi:MAG: M15 family metallopeptidase [Spirochaetes bacterium]|nr:M15 family metallopeptidase [Spirochaetota bacterium]
MVTPLSRGCIALIACAILAPADRFGASAEGDIFGGIDPGNYVTGRFDPGKHAFFVSLADAGIPTDGRRQLLRREAAVALRRLYGDFRASHPTAPFHVRSSTRTFFDQKSIWDAKWRRGESPREGKGRSPRERALEILRYSSMPGTSRHHWGTDFDLQVLRNDYYETGAGRVLYRWLVENARRYGFCQPYTSGRRRGYSEEKWHWSYMPLAGPLRARWNDVYRRDPAAFSGKGLFSGSEAAGDLAPRYVNGINGKCEETPAPVSLPDQGHEGERD